MQAHTRETQQAFLEGHVAAFEFFGGVFGLVRYDNLGSAVKRVLRGRRRVETDRFVALRSHYLYESSFTRVGKEGAHEKGGIEGDVGRFRRAYLVPVPEVSSLAELNDLFAAACITDLRRTIRGRQQTVGEALGRELDLLRAAAGRGVRHRGARDAAGGQQVVGDGAAEPVLAAGPARRAAGRGADRRAGDRVRARRSRGRPARAAARAVRHLRAAGPLPRAARAQARRARPLARAAPGARTRRMAGLLR